jgi:lysophospholipase L1-like esterase
VFEFAKTFHGGVMRKIVSLFLALTSSFTVRVADAKLVACVGDSITYGAGISDRTNDSYPAQLGRMLQEFDPQWQTQNFGVSGATLLRNGDLPYMNQSAYNQALASEPNVIIIMLGTNDSKSFNWVHKNNFVTDYLYMIDSFAQLSSKPDIWICKPVPAFSALASINNTVILNEIIPFIDDIAQQRDVRIIDLYTALSGASALFPDGIHPNALGAELMAEAIVPLLVGVRESPDFDGNANVDFQDFVRLAQYWLKNEPSIDIAPPPDGDGIVDYIDLAGLTQYWLRELGLISHWKLDEAEGDVACDSINGNNGVIYGGPAWQTDGGMIDGAIELDGIDDYISIPFVLNVAKDESFSIFAWVKGGVPGQVIISQAKSQNWITVDSSKGTLASELASGRGAVPLVSDIVITDGQWHRIGLIWSRSNEIKILYMDNVEAARDTTCGVVNEDVLYIGTGSQLRAGTFWSGLIDDVRIYKRVVTP